MHHTSAAGVGLKQAVLSAMYRKNALYPTCKRTRMTAYRLIRSILRLSVTGTMIALTIRRIAQMQRNARQRVRPNVEISVFKPQLNVYFGSRAGDKD